MSECIGDSRCGVTNFTGEKGRLNRNARVSNPKLPSKTSNSQEVQHHHHIAQVTWDVLPGHLQNVSLEVCGAFLHRDHFQNCQLIVHQLIQNAHAPDPNAHRRWRDGLRFLRFIPLR